jgi:peroxiredoxin
VLHHNEQLGLRVVLVAFAPAESLAAYQHRKGLDDLLVLSDPDRRAYHAFGFDRGTVLRVWLDPRVWRRYAQLIRRGRRPEHAQEDTLQLGGDVLIDAAGRIAWVYRSRGPEDRPSTAQIQQALTRLRARARGT